MTDNEKPKRIVDRNAPLSPGKAVDYLVKRRASSLERRVKLLADFDLTEALWETKIQERVPDEQQLQFRRMLEAAFPAAETEEQPRLNKIMNEQPPPAPAAVEIDRSADSKGRRVGAGRQ